MTGIGAAIKMRELERNRPQQNAAPPARLLALTGMSTMEDKRRAFEAGVDG